MTPAFLLSLYIILRFAQQSFERFLAFLNRRFYLHPKNQQEAIRFFNLSQDDFQKTVRYSYDKYQFGLLTDWFDFCVGIAFIAWGGLGYVEQFAKTYRLPALPVPLATGLIFFAILGLLGLLIQLPFDLYYTFAIEQRHGFNKQTVRGFFLDKIKLILISSLLGAPFLLILLWVMGHFGKTWWIYAWLTVSFFSLFSIWIYPTFLAPLFNKFSPLPEGKLKEDILSLSKKVGFKTSGTYVMDASKRSTHGNAYFTGIFGAKRIVLFDTLVHMLSPTQIVSVLAHELGHFKLHHIRIEMTRSIAFTGVLFYVLSLCMPLENFYQAFFLSGVSSYGALVVFGLWFGPVDFLLKPFFSHLSRRNEFAADRFAVKHMGSGKELSDSLLTMREKSHAMPLSHPLYSLFYFSHPPLMERLKALAS